MRISIKELYRSAYGVYGVCAFNVFNAEQIHGVFRGAQKAGAPVIIQITPVARDYIHPELLEGMINAAGKIYPEVTFAVHLDHGNIDHCISAVDSGYYQSVMIDASHESYAENIRITKEVVQYAHRKNIAVEAELGILSGVEDHLFVDGNKALYTDPLQVTDFVSQTHCDSLAIAVGTSHGAYKFSGGKGLHLLTLADIQKRLPDFPLVLHGASAVPLNEVERINKAGGKLDENANGVNDCELIMAIRYGVTKINIATDMRLIWARVHREFFRDKPGHFDMVIPGREYMNALEYFVAEKCTFLMSKKSYIHE